jgi:hypothetical protein
MDPKLSVILGIISGGLFSTILGTWQRGLNTGIICGICTAFLLWLMLMPLWLVLWELMGHLT